MDRQIYFDANRKSWDERVAIHRRDETGFYEVQKVLDGSDKLNAIEAAEIGDVKGLRIAHLQCHFGLDSICLARRGASVTGLDFSPAAIAEARRLADTLGVDAQFVEGNVYDARKLLSGDFDMVYVTWGAINWLPDIGALGRGRRLAPQARRDPLSRRKPSEHSSLRLGGWPDRTAFRLAYAQGQAHHRGYGKHLYGCRRHPRQQEGLCVAASSMRHHQRPHCGGDDAQLAP